MKVHPWAAATTAFAAGTIAAVGIAQATSAPTKIPDSNTGVITACFAKKTGAVRFVNAQAGKHCKSSEKQITLNQTGPQGTTGPKGDAGAQGVPGERGPSNGYADYRTTNKEVVEHPWQGNVVATLNLPAGNYLLAANTTGHAANDVTFDLSCYLTTTAGTLHSGGARVSGGANTPLVYDADHSFAVTGSLVTDVPATVTLNCTPRDDNGIVFAGRAWMEGGSLTATRVADLTVTGS